MLSLLATRLYHACIQHTLTYTLVDQEGAVMLPVTKDKGNSKECLPGNYQILSDEEEDCTTAILHDVNHSLLVEVVEVDLKITVGKHTPEGQQPDDMGIPHRKLLCCIC